jgi:hypothetical protein
MPTSLEKHLLFLFGVCLPVQLAYHVWPAYSVYHGLRVDFLSPTLFATDLLLLSILIIWLIRRPRLPVISPFLLSIVTIYVSLNIIFSSLPSLTALLFIRWLAYVLFIFYLYQNINALSSRLFSGLSVAIIWTCALSVAQFFLKSSVGSVLIWLGERPLSQVLPNVAKISLGNLGLFVRPYATFPHPNSLAGFLLVGSCLVIYFSPRSRLTWLAVTFAAITLPLTFSRPVVFLELVLFMYFVFKFPFSCYLKIGLLLLFTIIGIFLLRLPHPSSFDIRQSLNMFSLSLIASHPLIGVGLGSFIPSSNFQFFQPVHNIFLLTAVELGILPALMLIGLVIHLLKISLRKRELLFVFILAAICLTGLLDHYWLVLHQNQLLLLIVLSSILAAHHPPVKIH